MFFFSAGSTGIGNAARQSRILPRPEYMSECLVAGNASGGSRPPLAGFRGSAKSPLIAASYGRRLAQKNRDQNISSMDIRACPSANQPQPLLPQCVSLQISCMNTPLLPEIAFDHEINAATHSMDPTCVTLLIETGATQFELKRALRLLVTRLSEVKTIAFDTASRTNFRQPVRLVECRRPTVLNHRGAARRVGQSKLSFRGTRPRLAVKTLSLNAVSRILNPSPAPRGITEYP
jgi:hypothetical protein